MRRSTYNTANRASLLTFLEKVPDRQFTVESLYAELCAEGITIGKSSLYRILDKLCAEGTVRKFRDAERDSSFFQYVGSDAECDHHLHLKCIACGKLIHLECGMAGDLVKHIREEHGFVIDSKKSVLYGLCRECRLLGGKDGKND